MTILLLLARLFLGAVFLMSAVPKLASPRQFARDVEGYGILRGPPATAFAWALPFVELGAALLLLTGFYPTWASLVVSAMLLIFMIAVGIAMARRLSLSCSCFGLLYRERVGWSTQVRDVVLLALAVFVLSGDHTSWTIIHMLTNVDRIDYALGLALTLAVFGGGLAAAALSVVHAKTGRQHPQGDRQPEAL